MIVKVYQIKILFCYKICMKYWFKKLVRYFGSSVESEFAGFVVFSHIHILFYISLGLIRVKECPTVLENWPRTDRSPQRG